MSSETKENAEDLFSEASKAVDMLYNIRDTYFPANPDDKTSKLSSESNIALQLLDRIPQGFILNPPVDLNARFRIWNFTVCFANWYDAEKRKMPGQRAIYEYLRGKVFDVLPEYKKEAEDHLSKAVSSVKSFFSSFLFLGFLLPLGFDLLVGTLVSESFLSLKNFDSTIVFCGSVWNW